MFFVSGHRDGPVQNSAWLPEKETWNCLSTVRRTEVKSPPFFQNRIGFDHISILLFTYTQKKSLQTDALHLELYFEESLILTYYLCQVHKCQKRKKTQGSRIMRLL